MKTLILVFSKHHGNTKKLADAIASAFPNDVELFDITSGPLPDLSAYGLVGIASGIYGASFGKPMLKALETLPEYTPVFLLYTSAVKLASHTNSVKKVLDARNAVLLGEYRCQGYNTFGPFKLVGGSGKGHPDQQDLDGAVKFYESLEP